MTLRVFTALFICARGSENALRRYCKQLHGHPLAHCIRRDSTLSQAFSAAVGVCNLFHPRIQPYHEANGKAL